MTKRINIDVGELRPLLETVATMSGDSLSGLCANLVKRALKDFLLEKSIPQLIDLLDPQVLSASAGIAEDRMADLALGQAAPTNGELIRIARDLRAVGISALDLQEKRDREYGSHPSEYQRHPKKNNDQPCECL